MFAAVAYVMLFTRIPSPGFPIFVLSITLASISALDQTVHCNRRLPSPVAGEWMGTMESRIPCMSRLGCAGRATDSTKNAVDLSSLGCLPDVFMCLPDSWVSP